LQFRIGYAPPERFALKEHLGGQGVSVEDMVEAGLLVTGEDIPVPYDRFRDRVMFPISDFRGRIIAFGGRALSPDAPAKYLNSPETPLFHKGSNLYNGAVARQAAHDGKPLIVVEGYVDVIAMVRAGYPATGRSARHRADRGPAWAALAHGRRADLVFRRRRRRPPGSLPRGRHGAAAAAPRQERAFCAAAGGAGPRRPVRSGGREAIAEVLADAQPLAEMLWMREAEGAALDTPERRAAFEARLQDVVRGIADDQVRKYYVQDIGARLRRLYAPRPDPERGGRGRATPDAFRTDRGRGGTYRDRMRGPGGNFPRQRPGGREPLPPPSPRLSGSPIVRGFRSAMPPREALMLVTVINHAWLLETQAEALSELEFRNPDADRLRRIILETAVGHGESDPQALRETIVECGLGAVLARAEAAITHTSDWPARAGAATEDVVQWCRCRCSSPLPLLSPTPPSSG
jgi:DNA primase